MDNNLIESGHFLEPGLVCGYDIIAGTEQVSTNSNNSYRWRSIFGYEGNTV